MRLLGLACALLLACSAITTAQDIDEYARLIEERGGALETEPTTTPWGARMFRIRDPDGFRLTISSVGGG